MHSLKLILSGNELVDELLFVHNLILGKAEVRIKLSLEGVDLLLQSQPLGLYVLVSGLDDLIARSLGWRAPLHHHLHRSILFHIWLLYLLLVWRLLLLLRIEWLLQRHLLLETLSELVVLGLLKLG